MKYILKNDEPTAFIHWKTQEQDNIIRLYKSGDSDASWSHLPSSMPSRPEEGIVYYSKKQLADALLEEQGFICAYCNRVINNDLSKLSEFENARDRVCSMEHLVSRKENIEKTFDYKNLTATCRGGEKVPKPRHTHCDNKRGAKPLPFTPLAEACETEIIYLQNGIIIGLTPRAEEVIKILGLDIPQLEENRKIALQKRVYEPQEDGTATPISKDRAVQEYKNITQNKPYVEFCGALMSVLKNEFMI